MGRTRLQASDSQGYIAHFIARSVLGPFRSCQQCDAFSRGTVESREVENMMSPSGRKPSVTLQLALTCSCMPEATPRCSSRKI